MDEEISQIMKTLTPAQKEVLPKIDPAKGRFSAGASETRVLNSLKAKQILEERSSWTYYFTPLGLRVSNAVAKAV